MERATINGVELEYEIAGTGEPVVFIHGAFIADTFRPLLAETGLTDRFRLINYHRRGYMGSSQVSGPVCVAQQAADCVVLLRHLEIERAHVVGHSYGGVVGLQVALDNPELVQSLTLLEPALMVGASAQGYRESLQRGIERFRTTDAADIVDEFLEARWPGYRQVLDRVLPGAFDHAVAAARTSFESELPGLLDWSFIEADARRIDQPTLSVLGGNSATLSPRFSETHQLLLKWLPRAEQFVLPGATHFMQIEDPQGISEALADFLTRVDR